MTESPQSPTTPQAGIADAFGQLSEQTAALVRQEIDAARQEITDKALRLAAGGALLGGATVAGVLAGASAHTWLLRVLEKRLSPAMAAFVAFLLYGGAAGALAAQGAAALKSAGPPYPAETLDRATAETRAVVDEVTR